LSFFQCQEKTPYAGKNPRGHKAHLAQTSFLSAEDPRFRLRLSGLPGCEGLAYRIVIISYGDLKNSAPQRVQRHSREYNSRPISWDYYISALKQKSRANFDSARALWKSNTRERTKQYQLPVGSFLQHTANAIAMSARLLHAREKLVGPIPRILKLNNASNAANTKANAANTITPIVMLQRLHIIYLLILVGCGLLLLVSLTLRCS
jgi:hypothetical protein